MRIHYKLVGSIGFKIQRIGEKSNNHLRLGKNHRFPSRTGLEIQQLKSFQPSLFQSPAALSFQHEKVKYPRNVPIDTLSALLTQFSHQMRGCGAFSGSQGSRLQPVDRCKRILIVTVPSNPFFVLWINFAQRTLPCISVISF